MIFIKAYIKKLNLKIIKLINYPSFVYYYYSFKIIYIKFFIINFKSRNIKFFISLLSFKDRFSVDKYPETIALLY